MEGNASNAEREIDCMTDRHYSDVLFPEMAKEDGFGFLSKKRNAYDGFLRDHLPGYEWKDDEPFSVESICSYIYEDYVDVAVLLSGIYERNYKQAGFDVGFEIGLKAGVSLALKAR
jgi:hypothetical protein